ncbi:MAG: hypothetical protein AAGB10_13115 [Pseudomonadota bacterium]
MRKFCTLVTVLAALAACDNSSPAGGRGPFDPSPLPRYPDDPTVGRLPPLSTATVVQSPDGAVAQVREQQTGTALAGSQQTATAVPGAPRSVLTPQLDPNAALAQDVTAALAATPSAAAPADPAAAAGALDGDIGIDPNDESINLALSSQAVQERQRAVAQQRREAAQQQLEIVQPEPVPQQDLNANVVAFARQTTHPVGTRTYNRPAFRDRLQSASVCRRFGNEDEAQRQFLANGGPNTDRFNLDPDGDGFACKFDPEKYRKLQF